MIVVPEICALERSADGVHLQLSVPADLNYFEGHFPDCPLLPGVVQISWAIELGRTHVPFQGRFRALSAVKFMRVILPGSVVGLELAYSPPKGELTFVYRLNGSECSNGTALFHA
jgi:3-hydroxymyristoyl/3-hydroxydecanoyl-(acyl carrier protein) dehydratase